MKIRLLILMFIVSHSAFSQKYTISGYVENSENSEKVIGAALFDANITNLGTLSNSYGYYSITIPSKKVKFTASQVGYIAMQIEFELIKDTVINFKLLPATELEQVEVYSQKNVANQSQMSAVDIPITTIQKMPMLLGEVDVLKAIQLLPGVQSGTEGTSGIYVRGGGSDQNLILIDGVPVYNVNHLFGFFSIFNADAINDVTLIKGGFPARYGGRLSAVLDIKMKEGNLKKFSGSASIGLISSKLTFEGPIIKDKSSFIVSLRRTYIDVLSWPIQKIAVAKNSDNMNFKAGYFFWDLNAKVNYKLSEKDRIFLSVYTGKDKAYSNSEYTMTDMEDKLTSGLDWGNITSAFRWNHSFAKKMFSNTTLTFSRYLFNVSFSEYYKDITNNYSTDMSFEYLSGIQDVSIKNDFDYRPSPAHTIKFGMNYTYHTFTPGINAFKVSSDMVDEKIDTTYGDMPIYANEYYVYVEDDINVFKNLKANVGVHYSGFYVNNTYYQSVQPRVSARFLISENVSIKAAYSEMTQYLHLLTNSTIGLPTDLWLPVTENVKPQNSTQYAAGIFWSIGNKYDLSIEGYYKTMDNLIEYKEGASFFSGFDETNNSARAWENKIETGGKGESYGMEVLLRKNIGKTTGWIGYTLSWSTRQFENINFGQEFPYSYDRRHDIGIVVTHAFNERIDIGATWVYGTGNSYTLALERYLSIPAYDYYGIPYPNLVNHIGNRNNFRMPAYHRLDLNVNFHKEKKHGNRTWSVGAYNAYNRKNPFYLDFGYDDNGKRALIQYSIFPIIPSVSYKFDF
jgi:outer membrane receptor for ferrienterochelin and colicin